MGFINVAELKPEMTAAQDVSNPDGRFLLAKGTTLSEKHLRTLRMWGVIEVDVEGISAADAANEAIAHIDPENVTMAEKLVAKRFQFTDREYPPLDALFHICAKRKAELIAKGLDVTPPPIPAMSKTPAKFNSASKKEPVKIESFKTIAQNINLPSLPMIYGQINEITKKPSSSAKDIGRIISNDTSLSARLLRLVNSTFYGFPSTIDTLSRAVTIVGVKQLSTLALGISIVKVFDDIPSELIDMRSFWEHSIACGIAARIIATFKKVANSERLFVAGLLHDIGRLLLYSHKPRLAQKALLAAQDGSHLVYEAEQEILGFDHTHLGGMLLNQWNLPLSLENDIRFHHAPTEAKDPKEAAIVHLADIIVTALELGSSGERHVPPLFTEAWEHLGLSPNIISLAINQIDFQLAETKQHFAIKDE
jgi:HD-like signal output (HDOD) protein